MKMSLLELFKRISWKATAPSILLVLNSFAWLTIVNLLFNVILNQSPFPEMEKLCLSTMYFVGMAVSIVLGSKFFPDSQLKSLFLWFLTGTIVTFFLPFISINTPSNALLVLFLSFSLGMGLPSCLSYFADSINIESRGLVGGVIWSGIGFIVLLFVFLICAYGTWITIIMLAIWRIFGCLTFMCLTKHHKKFYTQKSLSYLELIRNRHILLYLLPWTLFSIINFAEVPILEKVFGVESFTFAQFAEYIFAGISGFIGGIMADILGRKRLIISGFIMLGIDYAFMSFFAGSHGALLLFMILDGITWGLFFTVFLTVIWGDLGEGYAKEKFYVLGGLPFLLSNLATVLVKPYISVIPPIAAFSFASFFLFLAVIPLMYAHETLPDKAFKEREIISYIEKAKRIREKFSKG